jgi:hypothetical protein
VTQNPNIGSNNDATSRHGPIQIHTSNQSLTQNPNINSNNDTTSRHSATQIYTSNTGSQSATQNQDVNSGSESTNEMQSSSRESSRVSSNSPSSSRAGTPRQEPNYDSIPTQTGNNNIYVHENDTNTENVRNDDSMNTWNTIPETRTQTQTHALNDGIVTLTNNSRASGIIATMVLDSINKHNGNKDNNSAAKAATAATGHHIRDHTATTSTVSVAPPYAIADAMICKHECE